MGPSRLTGALLARKGDASPAHGAYGGTMLEPIAGVFGRGLIRPEPRPQESGPLAGPMGTPSAVPQVNGWFGRKVQDDARPAPAAETARLSVRLDAERLARLRILAARRGRRPQQLLRDALEAVFATSTDDCPCVRGETEACCKEPKSPKD